jgi:diguanylate cyclase (GGDEF)-like protein
MSSETNFRIIIIDDNPAIHQDFIKILTTNFKSKNLGSLEEELFGDKNAETEPVALPMFQIDTATQGQEGFNLIKIAMEEHNPYSLAFVDIRMPPGWDGIETIKHIWEVDKDMQIVICTAYSDYSWEDTVQHLGTSDNLLILKKPFDNVAVRQLACALTKKWQLMNESRKHTVMLEKTVLERTDSLQKSLSLTRATLESSTDGILVVNNNSQIIDYNKQLVDMWKVPQSILDAKDYKKFLDHIVTQLQNPDEFLRKLKEIHSPEESSMHTVRFKDNRIVECYFQPHKLKDVTVGRVWSFRDTTQRVTLERKLEFQATHDTLTGLPNRVLLHDRMMQTIARAERHKSLMAVLFFDLDRFKLINDSLTHQAGDELLVGVANRLSATLRKEDTISRLGGDEFVVLASMVNNEEDVIIFASKFLSLLHKPFKVMNRDIFITASIGISLYPHDGESSDELLRNADLAMYHSKELGGDQFQFYTHTLNVKAVTRLEQEAELRCAIEEQQFVLHYQPQLDLVTDKVISVEALIRWQHPTKGLVVPMDFIPLAEDSKLIIPIGDWVIKTACAQIKAWHDAGLPKISVAVNVTTVQFQQENFVSRVKQILEEIGLDPKYLEVEVTENVMLANANLKEVINELRALGVQIVLDDFGTGNSSLNYLRKVPVDRLKIDKSFVHGIGMNGEFENNDAVIVQAIIAMAHSLNLNVVAEGIETANQLNFMKDQHCEDVQGFYISHPLAAKDLEHFLKER